MTVASGDHLRLLDQLADSVLVVAPIAGAGPDAHAHAHAGNASADFDIVHLSPGYIDPAGRAPHDIAGRTLLEAYPGCASGDGLAARAARVLADGAPQYAPGPVGRLTGAGPADAVPVMDLRAARYDGGVVFTWRGRVGDEGRLGEAFEHGRTRVALAAARDLLADSEQRAAEQQELALRLQRAMMPADVGLMETCGVDIAVRCRPAKAGYLVAGDWYDALQLPDGELLFVVGDIVGHGIDAVTGMVAARNTLRGLAATGADPHELLSRLNYAACAFTEGVTGTVICGRYDPKTQLLRWARAGHLPPVLVRGQLAAVQPLPEGMLLGMELDAEYDQVTLQLMTGDTLLFYTDGLIERRAESISDALAEFAAAAVPDDPDADIDSHVAQILANAASDTGDDACLLAVRIR
jgi:serine phosphatase RsbU (regulator of sigma subunit)